MVKRYRLARTAGQRSGNRDAQAYHLTLEIEIHNLGQQTQKFAYRLDGVNGLPLEGWWYSTKIHPTRFAAAGRAMSCGARRGTGTA